MVVYYGFFFVNEVGFMIIQVCNFGFCYGKKLVLKEVSFILIVGWFYVLLGLNGVGKFILFGLFI